MSPEVIGANRHWGRCEGIQGEAGESSIATPTIDWLAWVNGGPKPGGDEVLDPEVVADPNYGCNCTNNTLSSGVRICRPASANRVVNWPGPDWGRALTGN